MKKLRVAILGQGRSGRFIHADYIKECDSDRFEIVAVCDGEQARLDYAKETYGADGYKTYQEILARDDIEVVINALPNHLHAPVNLEFLKKGVSVFCDKPAGKSVAEIDAMIAAAKENNAIYAMYQSMRFEPMYKKVKEIIDSGILGRIVSIRRGSGMFKRRNDFQSLVKYDGGTLMTGCCHVTDQLLGLYMYKNTPDVLCFMDRVNTAGDADDFCNIRIAAQGEPLCFVESSSCNPLGDADFLIQAKNGSLIARGGVVTWTYIKPEEAPELVLNSGVMPFRADGTKPDYGREDLVFYEETYKAGDEEINNHPHVMSMGAYGAFYDTMVNGKPYPITNEQVRLQVHILEQCRKQNKWIFVND